MQLAPSTAVPSRRFLLARPPLVTVWDESPAQPFGANPHVKILQIYGAGIRRVRRPAAGLAPWQARRAQDFLMANLEGDPTIAGAAAACRLSISHFARAFKQTMGLPPHQWLTRQRLRRAKDLMQAGRLALAEIAAACGFSDQSHFTRVFVASEGQSPARWLRACRSSAAASLAC